MQLGIHVASVYVRAATLVLYTTVPHSEWAPPPPLAFPGEPRGEVRLGSAEVLARSSRSWLIP